MGLAMGLVLLCQIGCENARAQDGSGTLDSLVRLFSPELKQIEKRLDEIEQEAKSLPVLKSKPWGSRYGHRSGDLAEETTPDWLQIDLGKVRAVDMVALVPVYLSEREERGVGYGFPKRFKVEIADNPEMENAVTLVDRSKEDVPNPGRYPAIYSMAPVKGRYVRITSLKHNHENGAYFWALEELMILEGRMFAGAAGDVTKSSYTDLFPQWATLRAFDGQSALGMPVDVTQPSPSKGYLSDKLGLGMARDPMPEPLKKWCAVDLGQSEVIEQVRLLPLESDDYEVYGGRGFPRAFVVQLSNDRDFKEVIWESYRGNHQLGYPDGCSINLAVPGKKARYVRLLVDQMWSRDDWLSFGLAELQVYGSNRNLALGKTAYVKDEMHKPRDSGWALDHLVDGYNSRYRLLEWPDYLKLVDVRTKLELEKNGLEQRRLAKLEFGNKLFSATGVLVVVLVVVAWIWLLMRSRLLRRRETEQLRQQISRDLHDDIGSNLGGIILLSEIGSQHSADPESRDDFETIRQAAEDAALSMRDIVWLIQRERSDLKDFVTRMRQSLRMILKHMDVPLVVEPSDFRDRQLGLLFRRHVFLAFKEVLNNVRKHAKTERLEVKVEIETNCLRFTVRDEGVGFDPEQSASSGHGMNNLKRRASRVGGSVLIESSPGKGTKIVFEAPFSN